MDVAIVDEHEVVRTGLETWLADELPEARVVGSFADLTSCLSWLGTAPGVDVLVTEIQEAGRSPDMRHLRHVCEAASAVVVYSHLDSDEVILAAIEAGATAYVSKVEDKGHFIKTVSGLVGGKAPHVPPRMAEAMDRGNLGQRIGLSEREKQVLIAWFQTESKDEVGKRLHIAPATVRTHLQRIRAKYTHAARQAPTKSALLARAIEDGLIGLSELQGGQGSRG